MKDHQFDCLRSQFDQLSDLLDRRVNLVSNGSHATVVFAGR